MTALLALVALLTVPLLVAITAAAGALVVLIFISLILPPDFI